MTTFEITEMTEIKTFSPEEVFRYICTRNTQEIAHLMRGFGEPAAQAMFAATLLLAPRIVAGPSATPEKIKKAMNAFVGFRCTYHLLQVSCDLTKCDCRLLSRHTCLQAVADEEALSSSRSALGVRT